jgi:charged multivesicular body protein 4
VSFRFYREEHIQRKIEATIKEAKAKMAKGDKKGRSERSLRIPLLREDGLLSAAAFSRDGSIKYRSLTHTLARSLCRRYPRFYHPIGFSLGALYCMKRKKLYEQEADKIQNVKMTLETQVINLESAAQNAETFKAMEAGANTMKKIRTEVGIEQVDDMMDEIKEEMELANEVNNAIAQPVDPLFADEDELLAELDELEQADLEDQLLSAPTQQPDLALPTVPDTKLPALAKKEEDDLRQLEAELAGL